MPLGLAGHPLPCRRPWLKDPIALTFFFPWSLRQNPLYPFYFFCSELQKNLEKCKKIRKM
jgi:hypothetical protein